MVSLKAKEILQELKDKRVEPRYVSFDLFCKEDLIFILHDYPRAHQYIKPPLRDDFDVVTAVIVSGLDGVRQLQHLSDEHFDFALNHWGANLGQILPSRFTSTARKEQMVMFDPQFIKHIKEVERTRLMCDIAINADVKLASYIPSSLLSAEDIKKVPLSFNLHHKLDAQLWDEDLADMFIGYNPDALGHCPHHLINASRLALAINADKKAVRFAPSAKVLIDALDLVFSLEKKKHLEGGHWVYQALGRLRVVDREKRNEMFIPTFDKNPNWTAVRIQFGIYGDMMVAFYLSEPSDPEKFAQVVNKHPKLNWLYRELHGVKAGIEYLANPPLRKWATQDLDL